MGCGKKCQNEKNKTDDYKADKKKNDAHEADINWAGENNAHENRADVNWAGENNAHENRADERLIIDRFEGDYAICEQVETERLTDGDIIKTVPGNVNIQKSRIDPLAGEGSVIVYDKVGERFVYDAEATARRTAYIKELAKNLWG